MLHRRHAEEIINRKDPRCCVDPIGDNERSCKSLLLFLAYCVLLLEYERVIGANPRYLGCRDGMIDGWSNDFVTEP